MKVQPGEGSGADEPLRNEGAREASGHHLEECAESRLQIMSVAAAKRMCCNLLSAHSLKPTP